MKLKFSFSLVLLLSCIHLSGQLLFPIVEDSITYTTLSKTEHVIDKVWKDRVDFYTKVKSKKFEYEFFRLSDTTYHLRKFDNNLLVEKGDIILRAEMIKNIDTIGCFHCHPTDDWREMIYIIALVKPIKFGKWEIIEKSGIQSSGSFDVNGTKTGYWYYQQDDAKTIRDHSTDEMYYSKPSKDIIASNLKLLIKRFKVNYFGSNVSSAEDALKKLNRQFSIEFYPSHVQKKYMNFDFKSNGQLIISDNDSNFYEEWNWILTEEGQLVLANNKNTKFSYHVSKFGQDKITLRLEK